MALSAGDFTEPEGELRPEMFPGVSDLEATDGYLDTWLGEANTKVSASNASLSSDEKEDAKKAWVYYRAYHQVWLRLTTNPRQEDLNEDGSLRYSEEQVKAFEELAATHKETFEGLATEEGDSEPTSEHRSKSVATTTRW